MTESFATEFEKWLKSNPDHIDEEGTNRQENTDGVGQGGLFGTNPDMSDESESEFEDLKNLTDSGGLKSSADPMEEQAPILLDDDFDDEGGADNPSPDDRLTFLDEPPILEPVLQQQQSNMVSNVRGPQFSSTMRNYSRGDIVQPSNKKEVKRFRKAHSHQDASGHSLPLEPLRKPNYQQAQKLKESQEENIFDKFYSDQYDDSPPPLSPSPHAANIYSDSSGPDRKHPSYSPDFCAMEADSTSEINGSKVGSLYPSHRQTKNCQPGEVLVECDSTCMLAVSPAIVSPASASVCDTEEAPDCEIAGKEKTEFSASEDSFNSFGLEQNTKIQWALSNKNCNKKSLLCKIKRKNMPQSRSAYKSGAQGKQFWDESVDVEGVVIKKYDSLALGTRYASSQEAFCNPTVMDDAEAPQSLQHHHRFRQNRHTIDSPDNVSKLRKRRHEIIARDTATDGFNLNDQSSPPSRERLSAVALSHCHGEYSRAISRSTTGDCTRCHPSKKRRGKKLRRNTLPSSNLSDYYSHLPDDLQSFAMYTSQLSNVQVRMHMLLTQLFPQFRNDLTDMSPESSRFEMFLSDLIHTLEQPDECDLDNAAPPTLISYKDITPTPVNECPELDTFKTDEEPCSRLLPADSEVKAVVVSEELHARLLPTDSQAAAESSKHIVTSDAIVSCPLSVTDFQTCHASIPNCHASHEENDGKDIDIPLSRLSLEESVLTMPSKVVLFRQSDESLRRFAILSCRALQLLLPGLTVSLCNELAQSPHDLMVFIDNIKRSNSSR